MSGPKFDNDGAPWVACTRGCGLQVRRPGAACGPCQVGDAARKAAIAEEAARRALEGAGLNRSTHPCEPHAVTTAGYAVYIRTAPPNWPEGRLFTSSEARAFATAILAACDHVDGLQSPHGNGGE